MKPKVDYLSLTADQLKAELANDHSAQFAALAALGAAAEQPGADLLLLRARQADVRAFLAPPTQSAAFAGPETGGVHYASPPASAMAPKWWKKELARAGKYVHPVTHRPVDLSCKVLASIAEQSSRYLDAVGKVPFVASDAKNRDHKVNQDSTKGWVHAFSLEDDRLHALVEVTDPELAKRIGTDVQFVSMSVSAEERDEHGNVYRGVIDHVAATPIPVLSVQTNFEQVALSRTPRKETEMKLTEATCRALELSREASAEAVETKILELARANGELTGKVATLETANQAFAKREQEADTKALEDLLTSAKQTALSRSNPGAIDDDVVGAVTELWKLGKKAEAKVFAERLAGTSLQASKGTGGTKEVKAPAPAEKVQTETDELETYARSAQLQGYAVTWAGDRKSVTVKKGDLEFTRSRS